VNTLKHWSKIRDDGTQWLIRDAARTLVKQGNREALSVLGYDAIVEVSISSLRIVPARVKMGREMTFSFEIKSKSRRAQDLVIDYVVHHVKANGKRTPKVFKLTKRELGAGESAEISKRHSFRPISTRVYYAGKHRLEIQVNGTVLAGVEFGLG
jgi:hypothetical protein